MQYFKRLAKLLIFPLLIGVSLAVGLLIPAFYDWTGSDQSRPSPLIFQTAVGLLLCGIMVCMALPWLSIAYDPPPTHRARKVQFTIRTILVMTAVVALLLVLFRNKPMLAVSGGLNVIAWCYVVRVWILFRSFRWPLAALLACMYLPFAWLVTWDELSNALTGMLAMAAGLPAFLPTLLVSGLVHQHGKELAWLSMLLTSAELLIGVWIMRLGPRRFVAYVIFVLIASIFGSFILNALVRM